MWYIIAIFISITSLFFRGYDHVPEKFSSFVSTNRQVSIYQIKKDQRSDFKATPFKIDIENISATEIDDDDTPSTKYIEGSNHHLKFYYSQAPPIAQILCQSSLPQCWYFSYTTTFKYLLFCTIRI